VAARFGYFDEWFDEVAFSNTNLKREAGLFALKKQGGYGMLWPSGRRCRLRGAAARIM